MRITLDPADGSSPSDGTLARTTGRPEENGEFRTYGVPPDRYLAARQPAAGRMVPEERALPEPRHRGPPVELTSKDVSGVVITFTDRPSGISGTVQGPAALNPSAIVLAYPVD